MPPSSISICLLDQASKSYLCLLYCTIFALIEPNTGRHTQTINNWRPISDNTTHRETHTWDPIWPMFSLALPSPSIHLIALETKGSRQFMSGEMGESESIKRIKFWNFTENKEKNERRKALRVLKKEVSSAQGMMAFVRLSVPSISLSRSLHRFFVYSTFLI